MAPTNVNRFLLIAAVIVLGIGMLDAAIGGEWDLLVVMGLAVSLVATILARATWHRPAVPLRPDLTAWLRDRSQATGEPIGALADRAVAVYRNDHVGTP